MGVPNVRLSQVKVRIDEYKLMGEEVVKEMMKVFSCEWMNEVAVSA